MYISFTVVLEKLELERLPCLGCGVSAVLAIVLWAAIIPINLSNRHERSEDSIAASHQTLGAPPCQGVAFLVYSETTEMTKDCQAACCGWRRKEEGLLGVYRIRERCFANDISVTDCSHCQSAGRIYSS